jgi:hypothetical protein
MATNMSRYRGLRVQITQAPGMDSCLVTVAVKGLSAHWDEWSLVFPALRVDLGTAHNTYEAVEILKEALAVVSRQLE